MDAVTSKRQKKMSLRQERSVAKDLGGRLVAGSGAGPTSGGGDVRKRFEIRAECKVTEKDFFVVQYSDLHKIQQQAIKGGLEQPVLQVQFAVPRTTAVKYAIEPGIYRDEMMAPYRGRKRIKIKLSDLQRELLHHPAVGLEFEVQGTLFYWKIRPWTDFMKELEQPHADGQHDS